MKFDIPTIIATLAQVIVCLVLAAIALGAVVLPFVIFNDQGATLAFFAACAPAIGAIIYVSTP